MASANGNRMVLDDVPRVGFYGDMLQAGSENCPEDMPLPSCLRSIMQYLGETCLGCSHWGSKSDCAITQCSYAYFMSVCGQGFSHNWHPAKWDHAAGNPLYMTYEALAPLRWALQSLGYPFEALGNRSLDNEGLFPAHGDEAAFRTQIGAAIAAGRPVLGFGVVGPPEACIITGYDDGGDVLVGWSFFAGMPEFQSGVEFEPNGYFRKHGWFADTLGIAVLGEKGEVPPLLDTWRETLRRGLAVMRCRGVRDYASGIAAYDAWVASLLDEAQFASAGIESLREMFDVHNGAVGQIAEYRSYAGRTLDEMARALPPARDDLELAGGAYAVEHDLMWRAWECLGGHPEYTRLTEEPAAQFARPEARRRIADVVTAAKAREVEAAAHIERALARLADPAAVAQPSAARAVLEGVPLIGFGVKGEGGKPENTYMCAAMKAALDYIGEPYSYEFLMGTSGAAFRLAWNSERWDGGNISTLNMGDDPTEHYRRAFRAVGWVPSVCANPDWRGEPDASNIYKGHDYIGDNADYRDEAAMRDLVLRSIHYQRYPVLAVGVVYPPECGLISGYDESLDVIVGCHHFQDWPENVASGKVSHEADGRYRKRDWVADTQALIAFHYKTSRPAPQDTYAHALRWAVKLARTPRFREYYSGLAAYDAWAEALLGDADFTGADEEGLFVRLMCHNDALSCLGEGRAYAAGFVRAAAGALPQAAANLEAAALAYEAETTTVGSIAEVPGGMGWSAEHARKLAEAEMRRLIVPQIRRARDEDQVAISHIEAALEALAL